MSLKLGKIIEFGFRSQDIHFIHDTILFVHFRKSLFGLIEMHLFIFLRVTHSEKWFICL